jgi:hypothetical protein
MLDHLLVHYKRGNRQDSTAKVCVREW